MNKLKKEDPFGIIITAFISKFISRIVGGIIFVLLAFLFTYIGFDIKKSSIFAIIAGAIVMIVWTILEDYLFNKLK